MGRRDAETETLIPISGGGFDVAEVAHTLRAEGFDASEDGTGRGTPIVPVAYRTSGNAGAWETGDRVDALTTGTDPTSHLPAFSCKDYGNDAYWAVRRLTPREAERLQGVPDDFTAITYRGKPAADGPRYKALGNSMAVNCMRFIGIGISLVEKINGENA